eukprot:10365172-Karenia_brevis.AAC.1
MHYSCVYPSEPGGDQQCPICKAEVRLGNETKSGAELPKWHEVEVGAPGKRKSTGPSPEVGIPAFP